MNASSVLLAGCLLAGCVSVSFDQQLVDINPELVAELPPSRASMALNRYTMPDAAMQLVRRKARVAEGLTRQRCQFGERSTQLLASGETLANGELRYTALRIDGAASVGEQDGLSFYIHPSSGPRLKDGADRNCFLAFFPKGFPEADAARELQRLATAAHALGIAKAKTAFSL